MPEVGSKSHAKVLLTAAIVVGVIVLAGLIVLTIRLTQWYRTREARRQRLASQNGEKPAKKTGPPARLVVRS